MEMCCGDAIGDHGFGGLGRLSGCAWPYSDSRSIGYGLSYADAGAYGKPDSDSNAHIFGDLLRP